MTYVKNRNNLSEKTTQRKGHAAACAVLLLGNLLAPMAIADDGRLCYSKTDVNCDWIVDGQDLSMLLGAWGQSNTSLDLNRDCIVNGGDLAMMLGTWGALPEIPEWEDMTFENEAVSLCIEGGSFNAIVTGDIVREPGTSVVEGSVHVDLGGGAVTEISFSGESVLLRAGDDAISFSSGNTSDTFNVNGSVVPIDDVVNELYTDMLNHEFSPAEWGAKSQMLIGLTMLHEVELFAQNVMVINVEVPPGAGGNGGPPWWCIAACIAAAAAVAGMMAAMTGGCAGLCTAGSVVSFGTLLIPCAALVGFCVAVATGSTLSAFQFVKAYWGN